MSDMKFKVGDEVRVLTTTLYGHLVGTIGCITEFDEETGMYKVSANGDWHWYEEEDLELVGYVTEVPYSKVIEDAIHKVTDIAEELDSYSYSDRNNMFGGNGRIGYILNNYSLSEIRSRIEKFQNGKFKVGDEVRSRFTSSKAIITNAKDGSNECCLLWYDGTAGKYLKNEFIKTGRHFDISSILSELKSK